jgi:mannose-1-phosphate guanylyltransferase / mannose-6-phosphate isomerase
VASKLIPVALSGGAGTRLWPLSTDDAPKQFHPLGPGASLFQDTVTRLDGDVDGVVLYPPMVVCNARHEGKVREQLRAIGREPSRIVLEPFGRNTAPVAMAASILAEQVDPDALVLLMPADHVIARPDVFAAAVAAAAPHAHERFVLFGAPPDSPETGYGYIEVGGPLQGRLSAVARFVEKPDLETAAGYLASGRYLWNAGIFLFSPRLLIREMERLAPAVAAATRAAIERGRALGEALALDADAFAACPSISLDYAVMEHTRLAAVASIDAGWADVGTWDSLWRQGRRDDAGNLVHGDAEVLDSSGCLVWAEGATVGLVGVSDLVVVQTATGILVMPRSRSQDVRRIVDRLRARGTGWRDP